MALAFIRAYLDGGEAEAIHLGQMLKEADSDNDKNWYLFLWTIPSIKYRWEWISQQDRDQVMMEIESAMHSNNAVPLRQYLTNNGWQLLSIFPLSTT